MKDGGRVFTWANALTLLRLLLCLPLYLLIEQQHWLLCALCLSVAVLTDVFDGKVARKLQQSSPMGGFFDHATDALFVTLGSLALANHEIINSWLVWLIPMAFIQYSVDSRLLSGYALRSSALGRINGIAYFVLVCTAVGSLLLHWTWLQKLVGLFAWVLVASTLISMVDRLQAFLRLQQRH